jgi:hypothetical protein
MAARKPNFCICISRRVQPVLALNALCITRAATNLESYWHTTDGAEAFEHDRLGSIHLDVIPVSNMSA